MAEVIDNKKVTEIRIINKKTGKPFERELADFFDYWFNEGVRWALVVMRVVNRELVYVAEHGVESEKITSLEILRWYVNNMPLVDVIKTYGLELGYRGEI